MLQPTRIQLSRRLLTVGKTRFDKSFTQQETIPQDGIDAAVKLLQTGRLHR
jgi:hypothetical protein